MLGKVLCRLAAVGSLSRVLFFSMMIMGVLTGAVFPFFVVALGLPSEMVFRPSFWGACILAGLLLGEINFLITRMVLAIPLKNLAVMAGRVAGGDLRDEGNPFCSRES
jgi:methyl-accepting chemotaxis protein